MEDIFRNFLAAMTRQQQLLNQLNLKLQRLEIGQGGGGGGGNATISDYEPNKEYRHNTLVNDTNNDNLYLVVCQDVYTSVDITTDVEQGNIKLINSNILNLIPVDHEPTREEVQNMDEGSVIIVYNPSDEPYIFPE